MIVVKELELGVVNGIVRVKSAKGIVVRAKHFSLTTDFILFWAELELDYCGGGC